MVVSHKWQHLALLALVAYAGYMAYRWYQDSQVSQTNGGPVALGGTIMIGTPIITSRT